MKKSTRFSLRLQIRHFKNTFLLIGDMPFNNLLPDSLIRDLHQSGDVRETIFTPLIKPKENQKGQKPKETKRVKPKGSDSIEDVFYPSC